MSNKLLIFIIFLPVYIFTQDIETEVNSIVQPFIESNKNTGISVGFFEAGSDEPKMFFYGRVRKEDSVKPNENTVYEIGAITKTFTAAMLMMLAREGKMQITDPAQNYLPEMVTIHNFTSTEHIKLMHLVTHTSGLPRLPANFTAKISNTDDPYKNYTSDDLNTYINNYILEREPGTRYEYSNLGFGLLGGLLTKASGLTYENMLKQYITDSLGMTSTGISLKGDMTKNIAKGYSEKGEPRGLWSAGIFEGAVGIKSTIKDMMKYLSFNMGKTEVLDFKESALVMQKRRFETNSPNIFIGMAWHISETSDGYQVIWHDGGTGGFTGFIAFMPEKNVGVVVLTNQASSVDEVGIKILKALNK